MARPLTTISRGNLRLAQPVDDIRKFLKGDPNVEDNAYLRANDVANPTLIVENEAATGIAQRWIINGVTVGQVTVDGFSNLVTGATNVLGISGVTANGTTDCWSALQTAITAAYAAGGGVFYFPKGEYRISRKLNVYANTALVGDGIGATVLLFDDPADGETATKGVISIEVAAAWSDFGTTGDVGYVGSNPAVILHTTSTLAPGYRAVRLATAADSAKLPVGSLVQLFSGADGASSPDLATTGVLTTRVTQIQSFGGNTYIWLQDAIPWTFTQPTALPRLRYRLDVSDPVTNKQVDRVRISDLTVTVGDGSGNEQYARNRAYGIVVSGAQDAIVERVRVSRHRYRGIQTSYTRNTKILASTCDEIVSNRSPDTDADGCSIEDYYSALLLVAGCTGESTGWFMACNGSYAPKILGNYGVGRYLPYDDSNPATNPSGNKTSGTASSADTGWKIHGRGIKVQGQCIYAEISDNTIEGSVLYGIFVFDSTYCDVRRNKILHTGVDINEYGIAISEGVAGQTHHINVDDNLVRGASSSGIGLTLLSAANHSYISARRNTVIECGDRGIFVSEVYAPIVSENTIELCGNDAIELGSNVTRALVYANRINNSNGAIHTTTSDGGNSVFFNEIIAGAMTLSADDERARSVFLSVASNAVSAAAWTTVTRSSDASNYEVTLYTHGRPVRATLTGSVTTTGSTRARVGISIDGATPLIQNEIAVSQTNFPISFQTPDTTLAAGVHTFTVQAFAVDGAASVTLPGNQVIGFLHVEELR